MGQYSPEFAVGVQEQATIDTALDNCRKLCSPRLGISMSARGPTLTCHGAVPSLLLGGGLNRSAQHLEQLAINNDDGLPNRSPKCFQRVPPQPAIPITGFALPPSYHQEISDLSANNRSLHSKGKCCVDRLNPPFDFGHIAASRQVT